MPPKKENTLDPVVQIIYAVQKTKTRDGERERKERNIVQILAEASSCAQGGVRVAVGLERK